MRWLVMILCLSGFVFAESQQQPEFATGYHPKSAAFGKKMMVSSANPLASEAGLKILEKGGNAIDAAIAIQMVLNVVEPQSSGIGGGALLLYYDKEEGRVLAFDGRETAPAQADENLFLDEEGDPLSMREAIIGGQSVAVPGLLKMVEEVHGEYGKLPWKELFTPAIEIATNGFPISHRLHHLIEKTPRLKTFTLPKEYLFTQGKPKPIGEILKNPKFAETLRLIAEQGSDPFYRGEIAQHIVHSVQNAPVSPGLLSLEDLANYRPRKRAPLQTSYRNFTIYGFPPPSSGGIVIAQMLTMLEDYDLSAYDLGAPPFINLFCAASRLAYADRNYYIADPDFFPVPTQRLLDRSYLQERGATLMALSEVSQGSFPGEGVDCCPPLLISVAPEFSSTSQICVVDAEGNAVSMTTSIENAFGSTLMVGGFFLNNQLTDFSLVPEQEGKKAANRIEPGKRPMSSMSPTLVFHKGDNKFLLTVGSAGGAPIIDYVAQILFGVLDFHLNIQEAIDFPNYTSLKKAIELEQDTMLETAVISLEEMGNTVNVLPLTSGSQGIQRTQESLIGGADPRREGLAIGE